MDRSVGIAEAAAFAELFDLSLDTLLGRSAVPKDGLSYALRAVVDAAQQASWQVSTIETTLRDRVAELEAFNPRGFAKTFGSRCERVCDMLADVDKALHGALNPPGSEAAQRSLRKLMLEMIKEGE